MFFKGILILNAHLMKKTALEQKFLPWSQNNDICLITIQKLDYNYILSLFFFQMKLVKEMKAVTMN